MADNTTSSQPQGLETIFESPDESGVLPRPDNHSPAPDKQQTTIRDNGGSISGVEPLLPRVPVTTAQLAGVPVRDDVATNRYQLASTSSTSTIHTDEQTTIIIQQVDANTAYTTTNRSHMTSSSNETEVNFGDDGRRSETEAGDTVFHFAVEEDARHDASG